jgi:glycerophosphoryl diester phosphodiesterase
MSAFAHAVSLGYRYLETDVHSTVDGVLMAFHDENLLRTCGVDARIADLTYSEISKLRVHDVEHIPTFHEVLETWPDVRVNVDCKADSAVAPLEATLARESIRQRICLGSFSDRRLRHFRDLYGPSLCTSMGPREVAQARLGSFVSRVPFTTTAQAAQIPPRQGPISLADERFVEFCHSRMIAVHVWTIDDPEQMHQLLDIGVDGIMTDQPSILRDVMQSRGAW